MVTTARAVLSVILLVGFYVYAFGVAVGFGALGLLLAARNGFSQVVGILIGLSLILAGTVLWATWKVARAKHQPYGLVLDEQRAPYLWGMVRELATAVGTRPPDEIRLVAEVNAAVTETTQMLGLVSGRRYLYIGLPLLQAMNLAQIRFVLAHELGHYSHQHVRLGAPVYRGRAVIARTLSHLYGPNTSQAPLIFLPRWLLRGYAMVYFGVSAAVSRAQEVEADRAGVRLAGRQAGITALHELSVLDTAWDFYLQTYVASGLEAGYAPAGALSHFPTLLAARAGELAQVRSQPPANTTSRWDSHPSPAERIALIGREPEAWVATDNRPAGMLVEYLDAAAGELEELTFEFGSRQRLPFFHYTAAAAQYGRQNHADELYRAVGRLTGGPANLAVVLDLLAAGHTQQLAQSLLPASAMGDPPAALQAVTDAVASAIAAAMVRSGAAGWRHSWAGPATLVGPAGEPVEQWDLATRALTGEAVKVRDELLTRRVDLVSATAERRTATASGARTIAGITNAVVEGKRRDLVITSLGLVVFPTLPYLKQGLVQQRMRKLLTEVDPAELTTRPEHRFIPYEEIAAGDITRRLPITFQFTLRSGERLTVRLGSKSQEVGEGWEALAEVTGVLSSPS